MKTFYNKYLAAVGLGSELVNETIAALRPLFEKYEAEGYSTREISHLMTAAVHCHESERVLKFAFALRDSETTKIND